MAAAASIALAVGSASAPAADMKGGRSAPEAAGKSTTAPMRDDKVLAYRFRASEIMGKTVKNTQNETLGKVDDLVLSRDDAVVYAIVSVGGFLGVGDKVVAIRYDELRRDGPNSFVYNATKDELKSRPAFQFSAADSRSTEASADAYRKRMAGEVDQWKDKVEGFSSKAKDEGTAANKTAAQKIDRAWDDVKTQWNKLQNASDDTWQDTKAAFEKAWDDFQDTWKSATNT
jgi:sporulation protein YlmC with PRC-barrel domain